MRNETKVTGRFNRYYTKLCLRKRKLICKQYERSVHSWGRVWFYIHTHWSWSLSFLWFFEGLEKTQISVSRYNAVDKAPHSNKIPKKGLRTQLVIHLVECKQMSWLEADTTKGAHCLFFKLVTPTANSELKISLYCFLWRKNFTECNSGQNLKTLQTPYFKG